MSDKKSVAKERQVSCYPPPAIKGKLETYASSKGISKSEVVNEALRKFFCDKPDTSIKRG